VKAALRRFTVGCEAPARQNRGGTLFAHHLANDRPTSASLEGALPVTVHPLPGGERQSARNVLETITRVVPAHRGDRRHAGIPCAVSP
jgi:hypothetical protein